MSRSAWTKCFGGIGKRNDRAGIVPHVCKDRVKNAVDLGKNHDRRAAYNSFMAAADAGRPGARPRKAIAINGPRNAPTLSPIPSRPNADRASDPRRSRTARTEDARPPRRQPDQWLGHSRKRITENGNRLPLPQLVSQQPREALEMFCVACARPSMRPTMLTEAPESR